MVIEGEQLSFTTWLLVSSVVWVGMLLIGGLVAAAVSYLAMAVARGPLQALYDWSSGIGGVLEDWAHTSPRRVLAMAGLAWQESIRRRVIVVFVVFAVILLFAGWFLDTAGDRPARLYLNLVLTATSYLMIGLAVLLSAFSLPADIKDRTIYTVVSKPVRRHEIIMGRILGFTATGTMLLVAMGGLSYFFVILGLDHTHTVLVSAERRAEFAATNQGDPAQVYVGRTELEHGHSHEFQIRETPDGQLVAELSDDTPGHWHTATVSEQPNGDLLVESGPPEDLLQARVPIYGQLTFLGRDGEIAYERDEQGNIKLDTEGNPITKGTNVGNEWEYRSCVEGGTKAAGRWVFDGVTEERFPDGLTLEMTLGVFRTYKGDVSKPISGNVVLRNPFDTNIASSEQTFQSREYHIRRITIPRTIPAAGETEGTLDLFRDLVHEGQLQVEIRCNERAQFFCLAGPDVYLRAADAPFWMNFMKGYAGIWLQMLMIMAVGVFWSTILRGPVAMVATIGTAATGFFTDFMVGLWKGEVVGGGPTESLIRILYQMNQVEQLEQGVASQTALVFDTILTGMIFVAERMVPDFVSMNDSNVVASGFNVGIDRLAQHGLTALGFLIPVIVISHFCLKYRQVAE